MVVVVVPGLSPQKLGSRHEHKLLDVVSLVEIIGSAVVGEPNHGHPINGDGLGRFIRAESRYFDV